MHLLHKLMVLLLLTALSGCAGIYRPETPAPAGTTACDGLVFDLEQAIQSQGVVDVQDRRITGYPYLRVNRFLSSYRDEVQGEALQQWLDLLLERGLQGWLLEYANLDGESQQSLQQRAASITSTASTFGQTLRYCGEELLDSARRNVQAIGQIRAAATVEDNYSQLKRSLGLYPLTAHLFSKGIDNWHEETRAIYETPLMSLPVDGEVLVYRVDASTPLDKPAVGQILRASSGNPLAIPLPDERQRSALLATFAPRYLIDTASDDDRIGYPRWTSDDGIQIDVAHPAVFTWLSHTRFHDRVLLQLNYQVWFPARTASGLLDILAGKLDGLIWRVTLLPDGEPLVFDSIHACGCYHLFFAGKSASPLPETDDLQEAAFFPDQQRFGFADLPLSLHISSGSHYINRLFHHEPVIETATELPLVSANVLRSLPWSGHQHRSLYDSNGLVPESARLERFLFWPMGIPSAGAMRQPGHHATAFVGRRHFDDARLFESILNLQAD